MVFDRGPSNDPIEIHGWLLEDHERYIRVLDDHGEIHKLRKPKNGETRARLPEASDGGVYLKDIREADISVLWGMAPQDFDSRSDAFLAGGAPSEEDVRRGILLQTAYLYTLTKNHILEAARYAYLAEKRGRKNHAAKLWGHAKSTHKAFNRRWTGEPRQEDFVRFLAEHEARRVRSQAVHDAHYGKPRERLLNLWQRLIEIPYHDYREEAKMMVEGYRRLIDEDRQWKEPTAEQLAKFTAQERSAYWLYHLRDHDCGQWDERMRCDVLSDSMKVSESPNPASELLKLGVAAVPFLIEHMDDTCPTRCKAYSDRDWSDSHKLLRYGDCCQQIFEAITGHQIYDGNYFEYYPTYDSAAAKCKAKAQAWWDAYRKKEQAM